MPPFRVARVDPVDAAVLTEIAFAAKRHWGYPESWINEWAAALTISPEFVRTHPTFVAVKDGKIIGVAAIDVNGVEASLLHLWIRPPVMGNGVGRALFGACETAARTAGATVLMVESDPHADGFYHRMGARRIGEVPAPVQGIGRTLPLLEKRWV